MRRAAVSVVLAAIAGVSAAHAQCTEEPVPATSTWNTTCTDLTNGGDASCWIGELPTITSTVVFPRGTNAVVQTLLHDKPKSTLDTPTEISAPPFDIIFAQNVYIHEGAFVQMQGGALQVAKCLHVQGDLELFSVSNVTDSTAAYSVVQWSQVPTTAYLPDPEQPEGTDCKLINVGFTPRVCGPGKLLVDGTVSVVGLYSSLFLGTTVSPSGSLEFDDRAFYWGDLTNHGSVTATGYNYQHGFFTNYGNASMSTLAFDKWATDYKPLHKPLLLTNLGQLELFDGIPTVPAAADSEAVYRTMLINHGKVKLYGQAGPQGWDVINLGTLSFDATLPDAVTVVYEGFGSWINRGVLITNGVEVWLVAFQSYGGKLVMNDYGSFNLGNGNNGAAARASMRLCRLTSDLPSDLQLEYLRQSKRRRDEARHLTLSSVLSAVQGQDGCFWYADICYHQPYLFGPPSTPPAEPREGVADGASSRRMLVEEARREGALAVDATGLPVHRHNGQVRLHIQQALVREDVLVDASSCDTRLKLEDTTLSGDGTGSLSSTYAVDVEGRVEILAGGNWYVSAEHGMSPIYGHGKIVIQSGGTYFAGIDADFRLGSGIDVRPGGTLAIPKHAKVVFSNFSLDVKPGAKLHVDGDLAFRQGADSVLRADVCGVVGGIGDVRVDRAGRLGCSVDARLYTALHREQPLKPKPQEDPKSGGLSLPPARGGRG